MNLTEVYYELNGKVNDFLIASGETARCYAFGINPAQQKTTADKPKYPYFQSRFPTNVERPPYTAPEHKIPTWFDYQLDFYAAPENEQYNAAALASLFDKVMNAIQDTRVQIWRDVASLQRITGPIDTAFAGGGVKISFTTVFRLVSICSYVLVIPRYVPSTLDSVTALINGALNSDD